MNSFLIRLKKTTTVFRSTVCYVTGHARSLVTTGSQKTRLKSKRRSALFNPQVARYERIIEEMDRKIEEMDRKIEEKDRKIKENEHAKRWMEAVLHARNIQGDTSGTNIREDSDESFCNESIGERLCEIDEECKEEEFKDFIDQHRHCLGNQQSEGGETDVRRLEIDVSDNPAGTVPGNCGGSGIYGTKAQ